MIKLRTLPRHVPLCLILSVFASLSVLASALLFPAVTSGQAVAPAVRIKARIDESQLVTLRGNTNPHANARNDQGRVADSLPMSDLILVLSRDPQQQAAFDAYVASEYDENSPNYHQWLTPDQVGENFGPSQTDILTITNWLTGHGFTVSQVTRDRMSIRFGGNAGQVTGAFHTEIHNLLVNGHPHIANMSDPQIPASLSTVVVGVKSLHNFFPKPLHHMGQTVQRDAASGKWARPAAVGAMGSASPFTAKPLPNALPETRAPLPQFGINGSSGGFPYLVEDVGPWDFATIYNVTKLWTAGIDGTGQTIAIAGTSDIDVGQPLGSESLNSGSGANGNNDVATFRTFFDLPTGIAANTPIRISGNSKPLTVCTDINDTFPYSDNPCELDDLIENSLDVEWSASIAKNAQIILVASYPSSPTDDNLYDSESYIVDNLTAHIMNVSYGECELDMGTAGNVQYYDLWQTAAAEGIAVFVASGDSGSAACDRDEYVAFDGLTVSGIASTPWNTAVGGTDFNWCAPQNFFNASISGTECTASPHWSTTDMTPPGGSQASYSAIGYVPEVPWNDTCANPLALTWTQDIANYVYSLPTSGITTPEQACNFIFIATETSDLTTYYDYGTLLVQVVGGSGGASNCVVNSSTSTTTGTCTTGVTTTGSTNNPDTGASQGSLTVTTTDGWPKPSWQQASTNNIPGLPNDGVRDLPDVSFFAADGFLSSSAYLVCVSQDSAGYGTSQPCTYSSSTEPFAQEVGGTSVATPAMAGVMALINQKAGAAQGFANPGLYALAAKQSQSGYSACSAESVTASSTSCYFNDIDQYTNAMPCDAIDVTPNCVATQTTYGDGDEVGILTGFSATTGYDQATGLGSLNVANVVNAWVNTIGTTAAKVTVTPSAATLNTDNWLAVTVTVASNPSGGTTPTGELTLIASVSGGATLTTLVGTLNGSGSYTFEIPPNTLTAGTDLLTANYGGDSTYAVASNSAQVTVSNSALTTPTITVTPTPASINSNTPVSVKVAVTPASPTPTGTVFLSGGGYNSSVPWSALSSGSFTFNIPANSLTGTVSGQSDTLTATYSGDANYSANTGQNNVTVLESTFSFPSSTSGYTFSPTTATTTGIAPGSSVTVTVPIAAVNGYTGTVLLTCNPSGTIPTGSDGTTCTPSGSSQVNLATCSGSSCAVTFTIATRAPIVAALARPKLPGGSNRDPIGRELLGAGSGAILALLVFFGIPARRRSWRNMLSLLVALAALGLMTSCGGGGSTGGGGGGGGQSDPGTTAGTYTYTVTAATTNPSVTATGVNTFSIVVN